MSWASDNPEQWEEVCRNGIVARMDAAMAEHGFEPDHQTVKDLVWALADHPKVFDALMTWAQKEIVDAEADHFGGLIDDAMERSR